MATTPLNFLPLLPHLISSPYHSSLTSIIYFFSCSCISAILHTLSSFSCDYHGYFSSFCLFLIPIFFLIPLTFLFPSLVFLLICSTSFFILSFTFPPSSSSYLIPLPLSLRFPLSPPPPLSSFLLHLPSPPAPPASGVVIAFADPRKSPNVGSSGFREAL